jgi:shikimate 5-dehydrogenase
MTRSKLRTPQAPAHLVEAAHPGTFLLVGAPVLHSVSPAIWTSVFTAARRPWRFEARETQASELPELFASIRAGEPLGAFVTMPLKAPAAAAADRRDEHVERAMVANLVLGDSGDLIARNTDAAAVASLIGDRRFDHALVLGSGGAARAALSGLRDRCGAVTVVTPEPAESAALAACAQDGLWPGARAAAWSDRAAVAQESDLIVNATPLGMIGLDAESPLPPGSMGPRTWVYDFVYRPDGAMTPLQSTAVWAEAHVLDGLAHLEEQAVLALPALGLGSELGAAVSQALTACVVRPPLRWEER